jgi:hypothetical protein
MNEYKVTFKILVNIRESPGYYPDVEYAELSEGKTARKAVAKLEARFLPGWPEEHGYPTDKCKFKLVDVVKML